uniref:Uncharacterized protein n=1 Tax=viral metagenome TaxID=1070528 RepID=A0A6C0IPD6_9ZZZZ
MNYSNTRFRKPTLSLADSIRKQEKWRQKQIHMLYGSGRPIFQQSIHNIHTPIYILPAFIPR